MAAFLRDIVNLLKSAFSSLLEKVSTMMTTWKIYCRRKSITSLACSFLFKSFLFFLSLFHEKRIGNFQRTKYVSRYIKKKYNLLMIQILSISVCTCINISFFFSFLLFFILLFHTFATINETR